MHCSYFTVKKSALILSVLMLTACSSTDKRPSWVDTPNEQYPAKNYLTAVGEAGNLSAADQRSVAGIARTFEVSLKESSLDFTKSNIQKQNEQQQVSNEQQYERSVQTQVDQVLEGVEVVQHWQSATGKHYSLAVLNKSKAAMRLRQSLSKLDGQVKQRMMYASKGATSPVTRLSALQKALDLQLKRDALNRNLSVVTMPQSARFELQTIEKAIGDTLGAMRVHADSPNRALKEQLEQAVHGLGAQLDDNADYQLKGFLDMSPVRKKQGWYWQQGALELVLKRKGKTLAQKRYNIKQSATDVTVLAQRVNDDLSQKLDARFYQLLVSGQVR